ncbi:MAG: hypothetical protein M9935_03215 [Kiritimatiellae bacterium]|nr:hypothetical protein [Kiritimatiellia bacterium]
MALAILCAMVFSGAAAFAVSPITSIQAYYDSADDSSDDFSSRGAGTGAFPTNTTYQSSFNEGQFNNLIISSFDVGTNNFIFRQLAEKIVLVRVDNPTVTGAHHIILYAQNGPIVGGTNIALASSYAETMEDILLASIVNRGADNVFCNTGNGDGNNNNIERIDYIFDDGYPAYGALNRKGFMVMDRGGNDALWIAAILSLDTNGMPASFSKPVYLSTTNWGDSGITLDTIVYRGYDGNYRPSANVGVQPLSGQYIEWTEFDITTNTLVYGYSLAAADISATQNWLNVHEFPLNTTESSDSGGLDLMSGGALVLDERDNASIGDLVWNDLNQNGLQDPGEPGVYNVLVRVWDSTGSNLVGQARTDSNGIYHVYAIETGIYQFEVVLPEDWIVSPQDVGPDDYLDSDINTNTARSPFVSLPPRTTNNQYDAGIFLPPTDLGVTKTVNTNWVRVGTNIVFTMSATNFGPYPARAIELSDLIPPGLTYLGHHATSGTYTSATGEWEIGDLAIGAGARLTITARVDYTSGGWIITNTVALTGSNRPDTNAANNTASAVVTVRGLDISLNKTVNDPLPDVAELITYTITVTNHGPDSATSVVVTDSVPAGVTFSNASATIGSYNPTSGLWSIGSMASGAVARLILTARVDNASAGLVITNTATALTTTLGDTNPSNDTDSAIITVIGADLGVTKTPNTQGPFAGDNVIYTIIVTNNGPSDAGGVTLTEKLTNHMTYVSHSASAGSYSDASGIWNVGSLAAGASETLEITVQVSTNAVNTLLTNRVTITSSDVADGNPLNNTGTAVIAVSSLRMTKTSSVSGDAMPGSNITYTIVVTNAGSLTHTNLTITDPLPAGTTYITNTTWVSGVFIATNNVLDTFNSVSYSRNDGTVNWNSNWVEIGESTSPNAGNIRIYTNALRMSRASRGIERPLDLTGITNAILRFDYRRAALDSSSDYVAIYVSTNGSNPFDEIGRIAGPQNDASFLSTNFDISAYSGPNTTIRFLSSSSLGSSDYVHFDNVEVYWSQTGTNTVAGGAPPDLTSGHLLKPGEILTVTYTVRVDTPAVETQIVNIAYATSTKQVLPIQASATNPIAATDLGVTKTVNNPTPYAGSNVIFTIVVTNNGPRTASNVTLSDPVPDGFSYVSSSASRGSYSQGTGIWTIGVLTNNTAVALSLTLRVSTNPVYSGTMLTNIATLSGSSLADTIPGNNSATAIVTVGAADLIVSKTVDDDSPLLGSNVQFMVTVSNAGPSATTSAQLTDVWPAGLQLLSHTASQGTFAPSSNVWNIGSLAVGAQATLTLNAALTTSVVGVYITNVAHISSAALPDLNPNNNTGTAVLITTSADPLLLSKISSAGGTATTPGQAPPGFTNVYTIVITNPNAFAHTTISLFDTPPAGMTYVASSTEISAPEYFPFEWLEDFRSRFFNNNFGNTNWLTDWQESESGNNPLAGNIQITYDVMRGSTYSLQFQGSGSPQWFRRTADLSEFTNATLTFSYRRESLEAGDVALAQISSTGVNGPWSTLQRFEGPAEDSEYTNVSFDIRTWISTNVAIRFATTNNAMSSGDIVWIDDLRITASKDTFTTRPGGLPPWLATNLYLRPGDYATITYRAIVDSPSTVSQVVNTASVTSDQQIAWIYASVTDRVEIADTGIGKYAQDPIPDEGSLVSFTITLTNHGPFAATDVVVEDIMPSGLSYSSSIPSTGSFNPLGNRWTIPSIAPDATATLQLFATVNPGTAGMTLTNTVRIIQQRQGDLNPTNNTSSASVTIVPPFIITDCRYSTTNNAVEIRHQITNGEQLYDLLFADANRFHAGLTNWQLADRRAGGTLMDTGGLNRTAPVNLPEGTLRFYRISAPGFWEEEPRRAGVEIKAFGVARIQPGQNWVRPWGIPCNNTIRDILEDALPGSESAVAATRVMWFNRAINLDLAATQEIWFAQSESSNAWMASYPTHREGQKADSWALPLADGFCVELPTNQPPTKLPMIFGVPTNAQIQIVPGGSFHSLTSVNIPETLHPSQLGLLAAGFQGAAIPPLADMLWKYDRNNQRVPNGKIWFKTTDQTWRFDTGGINGALVPTNYFKPDDAIVIWRRASGPMTWTNHFHYPQPTRDMKP